MTLTLCLRILSIILGLLASGSLTSSWVTVEDPDAITPIEHRFGWVPPSKGERAKIPPFFLQDLPPGGFNSEGAQVYLWDFDKMVNGGKNFPCLRQETGDCTANAVAGALHRVQSRDIAVLGRNLRFRPVDPMFLYGVGRCAPDIGNGRLRGSAGAVPYWPLEAAKLYGVLPADDPDCPRYSGRTADAWGRSGPPKDLYDDAAPYKLESYGQVSTYEQARDALANGYPVVVGSNVGFAMRPREHAGKMWGIPQGHWNHQMCFIGVDDLATAPNGTKGGLRLQNSWGRKAHGAPLNGEPAGGFWVDVRTCNRMLSQDGGYAISSFDGFPYQPLDFGAEFDASDEPIDVVDLPEPGPLPVPLCVKAGISKQVALWCGIFSAAGSVASGIAAAVAMRRRDDDDSQHYQQSV